MSLFPDRWPVRWRIAGVSAGLTLLILLSFAMIVGRLGADKIRDDFRTDLQTTADRLAVEGLGDPGGFIRKTIFSGDGEVSIVDGGGNPVPGVNIPDQPRFGEPQIEDVVEVGPYEVAAASIPTGRLGQGLYVQYGETHATVDATVNRLWLLLGLGVLGGTVLALLAGLAVAQRAMSPIASLTAAAREVTMTRDPSKRIPMPDTDDEVAELARTLDRMLRELDAARAEAEQMVQAQRDFVADASHELRTPLTSVLANLELLEARLGPDGGEDAEIVAGALGSSRRMRRLVSDLLLLARADAGRAGPRRACDLGTVAEAAIAEVRAVAAHRPINYEGGSVEIECNPDDLHRLVLNLVENAVRHTPAGTSVEVGVRAEEGAAVIEVSDDGPGIPEGLEEQIFARFVHGSGPADVAGGSGTGLGIAIVRAVASAHGGTVEVGSSASGGARLTVRIPLAHVDEQILTTI